VTVPDSSWSIHQSLSGKRHQPGQPVRSRPVVDLPGRTDELELIDALLARRSPAGPGLLLRGDPGVGMTALLDAAAARAETAGICMLRVSGVELEAEISFSALHTLLYRYASVPIGWPVSVSPRSVATIGGVVETVEHAHQAGTDVIRCHVPRWHIVPDQLEQMITLVETEPQRPRDRRHHPLRRLRGRCYSNRAS
jgi:AAA ATPase domain